MSCRQACAVTELVLQNVTLSVHMTKDCPQECTVLVQLDMLSITTEINWLNSKYSHKD